MISIDALDNPIILSSRKHKKQVHRKEPGDGVVVCIFFIPLDHPFMMTATPQASKQAC